MESPSPNPQSHHSYYTEYVTVLSNPVETLSRATVGKFQHRSQVLSTSYKTPIPETDIDLLSFDAISVIRPKLDWFMKKICSSTTPEQLLFHITKGTAYGVSDGSFYPTTKTGSCQMIISTPDGAEWIKSGGLIPGEPEDQDPYRRELGKQLGLVAFTSGIQLPSTSPNPIVTIACDGLSALDKISKG